MDERMVAELQATIQRLHETLSCLEGLLRSDRAAAIRLSRMWPRTQYEGSVIRIRVESWIVAVLDAEEDA